MESEPLGNLIIASSGGMNLSELKVKLQELYVDNMENRTRKLLLDTMLNENLATRDIFSFGMKQAQIRLFEKNLDKETMKHAMESKIKDLRQAIKNTRREILWIEKLLRSRLGKRHKYKRCVKVMKKKIDRMREKRKETYRRKLEHYRSTQNEQRCGLRAGTDALERKFKPTMVSEKLLNYRELDIFKNPDQLPLPQRPLGPYICKKDIKLSDDEILILQKEPKFSIRKHVNKRDFQVETEKMLCKHRNQHPKPRNEAGKLDHWVSDKTGDNGPSEENRRRKREEALKEDDRKNKQREKKIREIWNKSKNRYVYNPIEKSISFSKRRPTDYKLNKFIHLPKPLSNEQEFYCEMRRRRYEQVLETYQKHTEKKNTSKGPTDNTRKEKCGKKKMEIRNKEEVKRRKMVGELNLSKRERNGLKSLKERIKEGELIIAQTDKSSRFAVLSRDQYIKSGMKHTGKDTKIDWKEVKRLQKYTNDHVWWIAKALNYCEDTDSDRMMRNNQDYGYEVPEMVLLVKDHKDWSESSGVPVPSRPVISGNKGLNTHLSELLSELLEPISLNMKSAEVSSTEEALYKVDSLNKYLNKGGVLRDFNILENLDKDINGGPDDQQQLLEILDALIYQNNPEFRTADERKVQFEKELAERDNKQFDTLIYQNNSVSSKNTDERKVHFDSMRQGDISVSPDVPYAERQFSDHLNYLETENSLEPKKFSLEPENQPHVDAILTQNKDAGEIVCTDKFLNNKDLPSFRYVPLKGDRSDDGTIQTSLKDFFPCTVGVRKEKMYTDGTWEKSMENSWRKSAKTRTNLNCTLADSVNAAYYWAKERDVQNLTKLKEMNFYDYKGKSDELPPIQDIDEKPVLVGGDVEALYPSMEAIPTSQIAFTAVMESEVEFQNINYDILSIYIFLTLGCNVMYKYDLGKCIPRRRYDNSKAKSLAATSNRSEKEWITKNGVYEKEEKRKLLALMVQTGVLLMMMTSCYSFAGDLYKQESGSGIGLRGSACLAKILMSFWDQSWARMQSNMGLIAQIFFRYIDDLRLYLAPITKGWWWKEGKWLYDNAIEDLRNPEQRTKEEIAKSLGTPVDFLRFTTESEGDFEEKYLPTLDFQLRVLENGRITHRHFSKPMSNNMTLENGTALSKNTIFSSLRQDLVRRLLNTNVEEDEKIRVGVVENFIQLLVNSKHKYSFIKSIVLQALTKYNYMVKRDSLSHSDKKFQPLYRPRKYQQESRMILKYINYSTWYSDEDLGEPYRQGWKKYIKRKGDNVRNGRRKKTERRDIETTTTMFVPPSEGGKLIEMLQEAEDSLVDQVPWKVKLVEKAGTPLRNIFLPKFPIKDGCALGMDCQACENNALTCRPKGVVYSATCEKCKSCSKTGEEEFDNDHVYIGETSRTFRLRVQEHMKALKNLDKKSFQVAHWAKAHKDDAECPTFKFRVLGQFSDAMSRQITEAVYIADSDNLNKKCEFRINQICRMEGAKLEFDAEKERIKKIKKRNDDDRVISEFITNIRERHTDDINSNLIYYCYRPEPREKRLLLDISEGDTVHETKRLRMNFSTPRCKDEAPMLSPPSGAMPGITPIHRVSNSPDLVNPELFESTDSETSVSDQGRTNMSNELRGSIIKPRKIETADEEDYSLVKETEMLVRSSLMSGGIRQEVELENTTDHMVDNYFRVKKWDGGRERSRSMSEVMDELNISGVSEWSFDSFSQRYRDDYNNFDSRVVIGKDASEQMLSQPGTPRALTGADQGRKRLLSPSKKTPTGRPRKFSTPLRENPELSARIVTTNCEKLVYLSQNARRRINYAKEDVGDDYKLLEDAKVEEKMIQNATSGRRKLSESASGGKRVTCSQRTSGEDIKPAPGAQFDKSDKLGGSVFTTSGEGIAPLENKDGRKKNFVEFLATPPRMIGRGKGKKVPISIVGNKGRRWTVSEAGKGRSARQQLISELLTPERKSQETESSEMVDLNSCT